MNAEVKDFRRKLGKRIKQLRVQKGLDQITLAAKTGGKDKQSINRYEKNGANPTAYILYLICQALDVSVNEIFDFSNLPNEKEL